MMLKGILHLFLTKIIGRLANSKIWIIKSFLIKAFIYLYKPNLEESLFVHKKLKPKKTILTNLHYDLDYNYLLKRLPKNIIPAYDGLKITL